MRLGAAAVLYVSFSITLSKFLASLLSLAVFSQVHISWLIIEPLFYFIFGLKVIIQLVRSLDSIKVPAARAMIIWMVGEYSSLGEIIPRMLITVLKYLAWCFTSEASETKLQILNTASKVFPRATIFSFVMCYNCLICNMFH